MNLRSIALLTVTFVAAPCIAAKAQSVDPYCYMQTSSGQFMNLDSLCIQNQGQTQTLSSRSGEVGATPTRVSGEQLVFAGKYKIFIDPGRIEKDGKRFWQRNEYEAKNESPNTTQREELYRTISCRGGSLSTTKRLRYNAKGELMSSRSDIPPMRKAQTAEDLAVVDFVCQQPQTQPATASPRRSYSSGYSGSSGSRYSGSSYSGSGSTGSGRCNSYYDTDSRGNLCGNRASSRRRGGR